MINLFKLDKVSIIQLKEMLAFLYPEYRFINVKRSGIVVFRKHLFARAERVQSLGLCLQNIPERLVAKKTGASSVKVNDLYLMRTALNNDINNVVGLLYNYFLGVKLKASLFDGEVDYVEWFNPKRAISKLSKKYSKNIKEMFLPVLTVPEHTKVFRMQVQSLLSNSNVQPIAA